MAAAVAWDLEAILDFLIDAALDFGEAPEEAFDRAAARLPQIEAAIAGLAATSHQGTLLPYLGPGIRSVTKGRAIFYFDLDEERQMLRLLAVLFGGQDHRRRLRCGGWRRRKAEGERWTERAECPICRLYSGRRHVNAKCNGLHWLL